METYLHNHFTTFNLSSIEKGVIANESAKGAPRNIICILALVVNKFKESKDCTFGKQYQRCLAANIISDVARPVSVLGF